MTSNNDTLRQAMRLMQSGDLHAATRAIQQGLRASTGAAARTRPAAGTSGPVIDGEFHRVDDAAVDAAHDARPSHSHRRPHLHRRTHGLAGHAAEPTARASPARADHRSDASGHRLTSHRFACAAGELDYRLFIPDGLDTTQAPLLLMLHGCTQSPEDFARGTRMNALALEHGYVVAWPAQSIERNRNRCWNWFRDSDQQRGHGEPAILAALTRQLAASLALDGNRVYVAGLSAGGAMAAVLASTHPDVYAAIGVHSGLPIGLASDVPSAFAAMRSGGRPARRATSTAGVPVPAIVFHGDGDTVVHPRNGAAVIDQSLAGDSARSPREGSPQVERGTAGGRAYTRTVHRGTDGGVAAEHWVIHGAAHAWSGGDPAGSYTDSGGPDASAQMLRFFGGCRRR